MTMLEAALQYAQHGFRVFPLQPRAKQPLGALAPHGVKDATTDAGQVIAWWAAEPEANIGVATGGGRWVLDLDDAEASERLRAAGVDFLPVDSIPTATTGKGLHLWFTGDVGNRTKLVEKVDVRGEGGYVVAPPSIHPSGAVYRWLGEPPFGRPLPPPPPALTAMVTTTAKVASSSGTSVAGANWVFDLMAGVGEGGRDDACTRLAGYYLGKGISPDVVERMLQLWADRCRPPFPHEDVAKCVASIAAREGTAAPSGPADSVADLIAATLRLIESPARNYRSSGVKWLDVALDGGFEPGTTTLIGGRPGTGKTAWKLQIARHAASQGVGVLFASLEMGATRLVRRLLSQESQVPFANLKTGDLIEGQRTLLTMAADRLRGLPLWIETRARTVEAVDEVLNAYEPGQIGLVMIDYLQKLRAPEARLESRARVEHVSDALTHLARTRNLPVVVASSLSRPDRTSERWRPTMGSLRESGQLEHDADNVILLFREDVPGAPLEVNVAKQRDGATHTGMLFFKGETLTFTEGN